MKSSEIKITRVEERPRDAWFDISLRQIREGEVRFYSVRDFLTGEWLFKVCLDKESDRIVVRAAKCPAGRRFAQLEGNTMLFQKSLIDGLFYDIISLTNADENDRLSRKVVDKIEDVPEIIKQNFKISSYEEATGKKIPGRSLVTLSEKDDEKGMITLFLLERGWTLSPVSHEERSRTVSLLALIKDLEKAEIKDVCHVAEAKFGIGEEEVYAILASLESKGQIRRLEGEYVKAVE